MFLKYLAVALQVVSTLALAVFSVLAFRHNNPGQNVINICATLVLAMRLENVLAFYRFVLNEPYL